MAFWFSYCLKSHAGGYAINTAKFSCPSPPVQEKPLSYSPGNVSDLVTGLGMALHGAGTGT